ncbi:unnamed protein product [Adineta ricciae]|uniref:Uncharacterized protein n=1 Tax=Adineta ricciae TaxID=249248 RepID=A0A816EV15_ADIRI|nr:unnamed protein product [Adineta ricciae]CAF1652273.1 unnamed protein product [Adineta ricciae]
MKPLRIFAILSRKSKKFYLKLILAITLTYIIFDKYYCSFLDAITTKAAPDLNELKIYKYDTSRSSTSSRDLIVIMTPKFSTYLIPRLEQLDVRLADNFATPLLIMHNHHLHENDLICINKTIKREVMFLDISIVFTLFPSNFDSCRTRSSWWRRGKWNYQLMIRFWFKILFELPLFQHYEYIMRLDDDSQILGPWINVFHEMRTKKAVYFANDQDVDLEKSLPGLMKLQYTALKYIILNNITVKQPEMIRDGFGEDYIRNYFNNFEVMRMEFFRRSNVRQWIDEVDYTHGILKYRWGDATLRYITLAMFATSNEILHRQDYNLSYCHKC